MPPSQLLPQASLSEILRGGIPQLGEGVFPSPFLTGDSTRNGPPVRFIEDNEKVLLSPLLKDLPTDGGTPLCFEIAGPRRHLFFDPVHTRAAIVTCGGLCPGLNDVIRSLVLILHYGYGVTEVFGIRYGFKGMVDGLGEDPFLLRPDEIEPISNEGGTYLGTSRGNQDPVLMTDFLSRRSIHILFCIGGDGTQKGALAIAAEAERRGYPLSVIGLPKTIDNDIDLVEKTFGFDTAVAVAAQVLHGAHVEAHAEHNGVVIVKLMGRESGFLATHAAIASGDVNFLLIPEVPFNLEGENGFLAAVRKRLESRHHALVVVAEGVAENLLASPDVKVPLDASGNRILEDVGIYLKDRVSRCFKEQGFDGRVRYIDPSYLVRSFRANSTDSIFCQNLAQNAVHAAMSGRTRMLVATRNNVYCHIPLDAIVRGRKFVDPNGDLWRSAMETTGQPEMVNR
jgi:6-phosphofructokinase 1